MYRYSKMKYLAGVVLFVFSGFSVAFAQDVPLNHLYSRYKYAINPAALSIDKGVGLNINYANNQFSEVSSVQKFGLGVDGGFLFDNMAIGMYLSREELNIVQRTNAQFMFAHRFKFKSESYLTLGLSAGLSVQGLNTKTLYQGSGFDMSDPVLATNKINAVFGFGANYVYKNLELDLAIPSYSLINQKNVPLFAAVSYSFLLKDDWTLKPQVMYNGLLPVQNLVDVRLELFYKERVWLEVGYRSNNEILFGAGVGFYNFRIDYMCGLNFGKFGQVNNGIHEAVISYRFKNAKLKRQSSSQQKEISRKLNEIDANVSVIKEDAKKQTRELEQINKSVQSMDNELRKELKGSLNEIKETVQRLGKEEIEQVDESRIKSTNYFIIVFSTTTMNDAEKIVARMNKQGEQGYILSQTNKKHYFVYTHVKDNFDDAMDVMNEERKRGYSGAWVLIVK